MGKSTKKKSMTKRPSPAAKKDARDDQVFKALANSDRRRILDLIRQSPKTTGELCKSLSHLNRCTVMLHLGKLEDADLILAKRKGKFRWNYLNVEPIQQIYNRWIKDYAQPAAELLTNLKSQLESEPERKNKKPKQAKQS